MEPKKDGADPKSFVKMEPKKDGADPKSFVKMETKKGGADPSSCDAKAASLSPSDDAKEGVGRCPKRSRKIMNDAFPSDAGSVSKKQRVIPTSPPKSPSPEPLFGGSLTLKEKEQLEEGVDDVEEEDGFVVEGVDVEEEEIPYHKNNLDRCHSERRDENENTDHEASSESESDSEDRSGSRSGGDESGDGDGDGDGFDEFGDGSA